MALFASNAPVSGRLYAAYEPLLYPIIAFQSPVPTIKPTLEVEVYIDGVVRGTFFLDSYTENQVGSPVTAIYGYEIDVQKVVQDYFNNRDVFEPVIGNAKYVESSVWQAEVFLRVYEYREDATTGTLVKQPAFVDSQTIDVINATKNLVREIIDFAPYTGTPRRHLTNKSEPQEIGLDESERLYFVAEFITHSEIYFYNAVGQNLGIGRIVHPSGNPNGNRIGSVGVGPANINSMSVSDWDNIVGSVTVDENVAFYLVYSGLLFTSTLAPITDIRRYYVKRPIGRTYRLHFLNTFGTVDSISIYHNGEESYSTTSDSFLMSDNAALSRDNEALVRLQTEGATTINATGENLTPSDVELYKVFLRSPNIQVEEQGQVYWVVATDQEFIIKQNTRGLSDISFSLTFSLSDISQSN